MSADGADIAARVFIEDLPPSRQDVQLAKLARLLNELDAHPGQWTRVAHRGSDTAEDFARLACHSLAAMELTDFEIVAHDGSLWMRRKATPDPRRHIIDWDRLAADEVAR